MRAERDLRIDERWYRKWRYWHTVVSVGITVIVTISYFFFLNENALLSVPSSWEILGMLFAVAFFGIPHGATDHLVASDIFKSSFPQTWLFVFLLIYTSLMGLVVLSWNLLPSTSLALFLILTIIHWGLGDVEDDLVPPRMRPAAVIPSASPARRFGSDPWLLARCWYMAPYRLSCRAWRSALKWRQSSPGSSLRPTMATPPHRRQMWLRC